MNNKPPRPPGPWGNARPPASARPQVSGKPAQGARPAPGSNPSAPGGRPLGPPPSQREQEMRIHGWRAAMAVCEHRRDAVRKVHYTADRLDALRPMLSWCAKNKVGYREVGADELERISGSQHHEGICLDVIRRPQPEFRDLLDDLADTPGACTLVYLDGVGNPHNLGAILRSCAHFGVRAVLYPGTSSGGLSSAACRVAEGGAEHVDMIPLMRPLSALRELNTLGFTLAATTPHEAADLYETRFPQRTVVILGAEGEGMSAELLAAAGLRCRIPGSGKVESLNVSAAAAVLLGEVWRQNPRRT